MGGGYAFGKGLYDPGLRLRAVGAYGRYHYDGALFDGSDYLATQFDGQVGYGAALIGYQFRPGSVIFKLFGGIEVEDQQVVPHDPNNSVQGTEIGFRLLAETWYDIAPRWFLSVDASYGTAFQEYFSLARLGFRALPKLSLGLEGGALGNEEYDAGRLHAHQSPRHRDHAVRRLHRQLSQGRPKRLSLAWSLPNVLDEHQSALPAPPRQCLENGRASCVEGCL